MLDKKKGEFLRLTAILALIALTVGIVLVYSSASVSNQVTVPKFVKGSNDTSFNFSVSVTSNNNDVKRVDVNRPAAFTVINCPVNIPAGWGCEKISPTVLSYTDAVTGIVAGGAAISFEINATASGTSGNSSWSIDTYETTGGTGVNSTNKFNVTIDADAPLIFTVNVSSTNGTLDTNNLTAAGSQWIKLSDLVFNVTITDVFDNIVNASIYLSNTSIINVSSVPSQMPNPNVAASYNYTIALTSEDPATGRFNGTLSSTLLNNGSVVYFVVVANDSVGNVNLSNDTTQGIILSTYNFTVDGAAPVLSSPNISDNYDAVTDNITTSDTVTNFTVLADDFGGSGVSRVELAVNISGVLVYAPMQQVTATPKRWNYTGSLQSLGVSAGDGNYTVWFRAYDNVTNVNESYTSLNVLVDDDAPQFAIGLFEPANTTESMVGNNFTTSNTTPLNFSILIYGNLNYTGGVYANSTVATIMGPDGVVYNLTLLSSAARWDGIGNASNIFYSSLWYSAQSPQNGPSSLNGTNSSLATLGCATLSPDGGVCPILINVTDIFGRSNTTNISITFDNVSASVTNISENATSSSVRVIRSGSVINFSVNAGNNIQNVTIHNASISGQLLNATLLTAVGGTNYSIAVSAETVCGVGTEGTCTVNFSVVDKALNINRSGVAGAKAQLASTTFIVDNSAPLVSNFQIEGAGSYLNQTGSSGNMTLRSDLNVTINFNVSDQVTNVTQVRIGNATMRNASLVAAAIPDGFTNTSTLADFGCPTNVEGVSCTLTVEAYDNASIDSSRNSNISDPLVNLTFTIDDLTPRVNISANLNQGLGYNVTSVTTVILFLANITDASLPDFNVSIGSTTFLPLNKTAASTSNSTSIPWNASYTLTQLGCASDGDCAITIVANDSAGNVNNSVSLTITSDSSGLSINNRTFNAVFVFDNTPTVHVNTSKAALCRYSTTGVLGYSQMSTQFDVEGFRHNSFTLSATPDGTYEYDVSCVDVAGTGEVNSTVRFTIDTINDTIIVIDNRTLGATFISATPTVHVNTSSPALCRYSTDGTTNYSQMSTQFGTQDSRLNSFTVGSDLLDADYEYGVSCVTSNNQNVVSNTVSFTVDTTSLWNITLGATGTNGVKKDYFSQANKFYKFALPKSNVLSTTSLATDYNVTNVLASLLSANPTGTTSNLSVLFAYNRTGDKWTSYVPGRANNDFNNFTTDTMDYYVNLSAANERIEIR